MDLINSEIIFTIVIPIYNAQDYITERIHKLVRQITEEFEIILVNDGSSDNSGALCDLLEKEYPLTIHVIHSENMGAFFARQKGVENASGEYICFIDADDYWVPEAASIIKKTVIANPADMYLFGYKEGEEKHENVVERISALKQGFYASESINLLKYQVLETDSQNTLWTKVIRKSLFNFTYEQQIPLKSFSYAEDFYQVMLLVNVTNSLFVSHEIIYNYIKNPDSTTTKGITVQSLKSLLFVYREYLKFVQLWDFPLEKAKQRLVEPIKHGLYAVLFGYHDRSHLINLIFTMEYLEICKMANISTLQRYYKVACYFIRHNHKSILSFYAYVFSAFNKLRTKFHKGE